MCTCVVQVVSEVAFEHLRTSFMAAFDENGDNKIDITEVIRFIDLSVTDVGLSAVICVHANVFATKQLIFAGCMVQMIEYVLFHL